MESDRFVAAFPPPKGASIAGVSVVVVVAAA